MRIAKRLGRTGLIRIAASIALLLVSTRPAAAVDEDAIFDITTLGSQGRTVAAELADLNGDGRTDLFVVLLLGVGTEEQRLIQVYLGRDEGGLPTTPSYNVAVPRWSAVYDLGDVKPAVPGQELILLRPDGVTVLSLGDASAPRWDLKVPGPSSPAVAEDERGFDRFKILYSEFAPEPWLLVPQIGQLTALSAMGEVMARLSLPRRANYAIRSNRGLFSVESDFQVFLDVPKLAVGDVDGDGEPDFVSSTRHEIRVFLRGEDGSYPFEPSRRHALGLVTPRDHIRGSGGVTSEVGDIDGDGLLDLVVTHVSGSFRDAATTTYVYLNRDGRWKLGEPDQTIETAASIVSNALFDLDGDGAAELLRVELHFSLLELIELLVSRELDIDVSLHRYDPDKGFGKKAWMKKKLSLPFSFDTFRFKGFEPVANEDLNGDGLLDFVQSGDGDALEVYLGSHDEPFDKRSGRLEISTAGMIHWGDLDGDGLRDFVIYDPHNFDVPVRVGRNTGRLPGTPARLARSEK